MILYGISETAVIPVRIEPSEKSEMVTQILFGETYKIIEEKDNWINIEITHDGYKGWIDKKTGTTIDQKYFDCTVNEPFIVIDTIYSKVTDLQTSEIILIPFGSTIPCFNSAKNEFRIHTKKYQFINESDTEIKKDVITKAKKLVNTPYLWGGKNPFGMDCSGFVQLIFKTELIFLPRDASKQVEIGNTVGFTNNVKPGDVAFFDNDEGEITHTGILISENQIIHASGKVRIDSFDHQGIFNEEKQKYTHKLRIIKRIL